MTSGMYRISALVGRHNQFTQRLAAPPRHAPVRRRDTSWAVRELTRKRVPGGLLALVLVLVCTAAFGAIASAATPVLPSADPFYAYSGPLKGIAPGTVLRTRTITLADLGVTSGLSATQILYRTINELRQPTVTVATIIRPTVALTTPKLLSYQTAYDALGGICDPSYTLQGGNSHYESAELEANAMLAYAELGYTVVTADYEGEAFDYGAGQEAGYDTLDGVRAAENLLGLSPADTPVALEGYSGGSIATDWASELAPTYAPKLDIVGTAEGGIPVDYAHVFHYVNPTSSMAGVLPAALLGLSRGFHIDLTPYLSPLGRQVFAADAAGCANTFDTVDLGPDLTKLFKPEYHGFSGVPALAPILNKMIMSTAGTPAGPLFIANGDSDGTGDGLMPVRDVQQLAHIYCQRGRSVEFHVYNGISHDDAFVVFLAEALPFITARLNDKSVANGCSSIAAGNPLTPLAVPAGSTQQAPVLTAHDLRETDAGRALQIELSAPRSPLTGLLARVWHGHRVIFTRRLPRISGTTRRYVLGTERHRLPAGRYTVTIVLHRRLLLRRELDI